MFFFKKKQIKTNAWIGPQRQLIAIWKVPGHPLFSFGRAAAAVFAE
jgi:hypothetical protein